MKEQDHYKVLGVPVDADQTAIKAAWKALIKRHHPDRSLKGSRDPEANHISASINEAYYVLRDPVRRLLFDLERVLPPQADSHDMSTRGHSSQQGSRQNTRPPSGHAATWSPGPRTERSRESPRTGVAAVLGRIVEFLSVPATMIGIGIVLVLMGGYLTAAIAMDFIVMAVIGAPVTVTGLLFMATGDGRLIIIGSIVSVVGLFLTIAGIYRMVTSAPIPVVMTLVGATIIVLAAQVGTRHGNFTSKRVNLSS